MTESWQIDVKNREDSVNRLDYPSDSKRHDASKPVQTQLISLDKLCAGKSNFSKDKINYFYIRNKRKDLPKRR
jgi:hypothetical protein